MNFSFVKAFIWAILIFIGSSISGNSLNEIKFINIPGLDKLIHFTWYFVLCLFLLSGIKRKLGVINIFHIVSITILCIGYGGLLEYLQKTFFVSRSMDIFDFIANSSGAIVGALLFSSLYKINFWRKIL